MENMHDRVEKYLINLNNNMLFDELSDSYLERLNLADILSGVPVPITPYDDVGDDFDSYHISDFSDPDFEYGFADEGGTQLTTLSIALSMARVIGADNNFPYKDQYLMYFDRVIGPEFIKVVISEGARVAGLGDYEVACTYFRAALLIDPKSCDALYLYGRALKDAYEIETVDENYVGDFKAESLEAFEVLTMMHPDFAMGYYFLGYAYANLGLYLKAKLTWETFMSLTEGEGAPDHSVNELREEIGSRIDSLKDPVIIESGVNLVLTGDYAGALDVLLPYTEGAYSEWWPLWYYLANAEIGVGDGYAAIEYYKKTLSFSPSNIDVMQELVEVCEVMGEEETAQKYRRKIEIVQYNLEQEKNGL